MLELAWDLNFTGLRIDTETNLDMQSKVQNFFLTAVDQIAHFQSRIFSQLLQRKMKVSA